MTRIVMLRNQPPGHMPAVVTWPSAFLCGLIEHRWQRWHAAQRAEVAKVRVRARIRLRPDTPFGQRLALHRARKNQW